MRNLNLLLAIFFGMVLAAFAGTESYTGKEMKQVQPAPCPEWYGDTEWNVSIWGAYAFTGTESNRSGREQADDEAIFGTYVCSQMISAPVLLARNIMSGRTTPLGAP
ncbi:MAG: hypothetical protein DME32_12785 [Verrucomicrobia bacterium]|nr:MAG: hypothetical protein DME32_12785 [Verrucomicrobiota bacterium]